MFKKKTNNPSLWDNPEAVALHYLKMKIDLNEHQKNTKAVDNGEYYRTGSDIERYLKEIETRKGFDEMMGNPMEMIDNLWT